MISIFNIDEYLHIEVQGWMRWISFCPCQEFEPTPSFKKQSTYREIQRSIQKIHNKLWEKLNSQ